MVVVRGHARVHPHAVVVEARQLRVAQRTAHSAILPTGCLAAALAATLAALAALAATLAALAALAAALAAAAALVPSLAAAATRLALRDQLE